MHSRRLWIALACGLFMPVVAGLLLVHRTTTFDANGRSVAAKTEEVQLVSALEVYRADFGDYPRGSAGDVMHWLRGENPHQIAYHDMPAKFLNERGALLDPWGTPYRIEFNSAARARMSSAGKNKVFDGNAPGSDDVSSWH